MQTFLIAVPIVLIIAVYVTARWFYQRGVQDGYAQARAQVVPTRSITS